MDFEIRDVTEDELPEFSRVGFLPFGHHPDAADIEDTKAVMELGRTMAAFDGGRMVGTASAFTMDLTLPGGATIPTAGVTAVGVVPTHRRRGILTGFMTRQLDDVAARGEPIAALTASESVIYGRFGYGLAMSAVTIQVTRAHAALAHGVADDGRVDLVSSDDIAGVVPPLFDRLRRSRPGQISRPEGWWRIWLRDPEPQREGASARFCATHTGPAGVDGYVTYRLKPIWHAGVAEYTLLVEELETENDAARAGLWRFLLGVDLVHTIEFGIAPLDEPLRWMLADPRRLRWTALGDFIWVRLVDVARALSARRYGAEGELSIELTDRFRPANDGVYRLDAGPEGAECRRDNGTASADLTMRVADLSAAYLGGVRLSTLARAGRVTANNPSALAKADALFACEPLAFNSTDF